jgi:hypothetical protein
MKSALLKRISQISLLACGIAFTALLPGLVLTTHPVVAQTSNTSGTTTTIQKFREKLFAGVNLTSEQNKQIQGIRAMRARRLKVALTKEQYSNLRQSMNSGKSLGQAFDSMQPPLDEKQQLRIVNILDDTSNQIWNALTPPQQQTVIANLQKMELTRDSVE